MKNIFLQKKTIGLAVFLLSAVIYQAAAQNSDIVSVTGDILTIYTLGNASDEMKIPDATAVGAYFSSPTVSAKKNGFYTATNLYATFKPFSWLEGYFKLYSIDRPGSFYLPLSLEPNGVKSLTADFITLDSVYGRVSVFEAVNLELPVELFLKAGRYKAQASHYGSVSKYFTEQILYLQNTKTDLTYEVGVGLKSPNITVSFATNYLLSESVQRYYDEDGMLDHGNPVLNEFAPQFVVMAKLPGLGIGESSKLSAELLYGNNVAGIYSGHSAGFSARYSFEELTDVSIPIGLSFMLYEKNVDLLGRAAVLPSTATGKGSMDFRTSWSIGLGTGVSFSSADLFNLDFNLGGTFNMITHYYRTDLPVIQLSVDALFTLKKYFFVGGGFFAGTLLDAEWKTKDDVTKEDYNHTFTFANNLGYEVYAGINFGGTGGKFVIGFNQNKGLSLNHMLEAKPEGQMKYKQEGTEWNFSDKLVEAGGLYFKFLFRF